jgi:hypothetical protein
MSNATALPEAPASSLWLTASNVLSSLPLEDVADRISETLPRTMPSGLQILLWTVITILLLALLEQLKYRIGRIGSNTTLPGEGRMHLQ